ncbi:hypothetical protein GRI42_08015 [Erythrobacter gaetbuli]|uniref:Uncharacterized protein n=1 Tax=Qipengyuania gaetbuli TaxID=266952 RepID=A0A844Y119_9SPHN|nr:hypothetical protein [Qipengyuania gaetbuli]MXO51249.1 hypothetical protein [Qipengyuania gaetbuli]
MSWIDHLGSGFLVLACLTVLFVIVGFLQSEVGDDYSRDSKPSAREFAVYSLIAILLGIVWAYWAFAEFMAGGSAWYWVAMLTLFAVSQLVSGYSYARQALSRS